MTQVSLSHFATHLTSEAAFDVLAIARRLKAQGKDVIELQIGDSPFPTSKHATEAGLQAIRDGHTHYCPSPGLPSFREGIARAYQKEFGIAIGPENVVVGAGAKVFQQFFCEAFLNPGDAVLVFSPYFATYTPNIQRRQGEMVFSPLRQSNAFRPDLNDVEAFVKRHPRAKAIFLNSPHNPTGGVATAEDLHGLANILRNTNIALFSDEPYCHMVWEGKHETPLSLPGMLERTVSVYTFSKSYSMSGWRLGYAVCAPQVAEVMGKMVNTFLSCVPPMVQLAGLAGLEHDSAERDEVMGRFRKKVELLVAALRDVPQVQVLMPAGTFYVFPDISALCRRLRITSHGFALYLLEGADPNRGVACLGGECFGPEGAGFLRFSCAEPDTRLLEAVAFLREAAGRSDRVEAYLRDHPEHRAA